MTLKSHHYHKRDFKSLWIGVDKAHIIIIKDKYNQPTVNIKLNWENSKHSLKIQEQEYSFFQFLLSTVHYSQRNSTEKEIKGIQMRRETGVSCFIGV